MDNSNNIESNIENFCENKPFDFDARFFAFFNVTEESTKQIMSRDQSLRTSILDIAFSDKNYVTLKREYSFVNKSLNSPIAFRGGENQIFFIGSNDVNTIGRLFNKIFYRKRKKIKNFINKENDILEQIKNIKNIFLITNGRVGANPYKLGAERIKKGKIEKFTISFELKLGNFNFFQIVDPKNVIYANEDYNVFFLEKILFAVDKKRNAYLTLLEEFEFEKTDFYFNRNIVLIIDHQKLLHFFNLDKPNDKIVGRFYNSGYLISSGKEEIANDDEEEITFISQDEIEEDKKYNWIEITDVLVLSLKRVIFQTEKNGLFIYDLISVKNQMVASDLDYSLKRFGRQQNFNYGYGKFIAYDHTGSPVLINSINGKIFNPLSKIGQKKKTNRDFLEVTQVAIINNRFIIQKKNPASLSIFKLDGEKIIEIIFFPFSECILSPLIEDPILKNEADGNFTNIYLLHLRGKETNYVKLDSDDFFYNYTIKDLDLEESVKLFNQTERNTSMIDLTTGDVIFLHPDTYIDRENSTTAKKQKVQLFYVHPHLIEFKYDSENEGYMKVTLYSIFSPKTIVSI